MLGFTYACLKELYYTVYNFDARSVRGLGILETSEGL